MNNRFQPIKLLKENPGCRVILASQNDGRKVVIKEVKLQAHEVWFSQFRMEVQVLQALEGNFVPSLFGVHDSPGACWLVEEYLEGIDLAAWLQSNPSKALRQQIFLEILERIQSVHEAGYLYLDLKPENILIHEGHAWLIDFNACMPIGSIRPILVNRDSLPPEGLEGKRMNEKADQIGLGKLYLLFFGPSSIAWTALSRNPNHRFRNLDVFAAQIRKPPKLKMALMASATGLLCIGVMIWLFYPASTNAANSKLPDAVKVCEELKNELKTGSLVLSESEWIIDARSCLEASHLSLAGFLHEHKPDTESFQVEFYDFLLGLLLSSDVSIAQLDSLLERIFQQAGWVEQFKDLCKGLMQARIILDPDQIHQLLIVLDAHCPLDDESCTCLMNYLLTCLSRRNHWIELPENLEANLVQSCPDLYELYARTKP